MTGDLRDLTFVASEIGKQLNTIFIEELGRVLINAQIAATSF